MELIKKSWLILSKTDKKNLIKLIFFNFIVIIFELLTLSILVQALNIFTDTSADSKVFFLKELSNFFEDDQNLLIFFVFLFFFIYLLKSILLILFYSKQYQFTYDLKAKFTSNVFSHYLYSPYSFHLNNNSHELIRNVGNEVSLVSTGIIHQLIIIGTELLIIGSIIIFLIIQSPKIILTLLLFFLIIGILYYLSTSKKIRDLGHLRQTVTTDIVKKTMNSLYGIKDIKILGKEDYFSKLFKNSAYDLSRLSRTISILSQIPKVIIEMALISIVGIIALSLSGNISEITKVAGLLIFAGLRLMPSISKILFSIQQLKYNKPAMNVVYDILKISDEKILDSKNDNNISTINFDKNIEFQNIKFRYKDGREIFNNINVIFNKGDKIGIFGGSGNGKSTFIDLLSSLIEPTDGTILVDGQKLNEINKISWRKKIGYVPQQVYIADDTLRKNIALGVEDKFIDDEKIKSIIKKTNLDNFKSIKNIDEILNVKISNRGLNISGGELQRVALARALYVDTEILILDEATNALDEKNKTELLDNIFELYKNKTIVFITHEEKILKNFNRIFELKNKNLNEK